MKRDVFEYAIIVVIILAFIGGIVFLLTALDRQDTPARKATVYSNDGKILKEYTGKIEYIRRNNEGIRFRFNDKRVIIQGGITVIEEE